MCQCSKCLKEKKEVMVCGECYADAMYELRQLRTKLKLIKEVMSYGEEKISEGRRKV